SVLECTFESTHLTSRSLPSYSISCLTQHMRRIAPRLCACLEMVLFRQPNVLHRDQAILDYLERELVLNLFDTKARRRLVLNDESFDVIVRKIASPDNRNVTPRSIADPLLLAVQDPRVAVLLRGRC